MKSLDYHHDESKIGPGKFFLGLNLVFAVLVILNFERQHIFILCGLILLLGHLLYWFARPVFVQISLSWIALSERISKVLAPVFLTLFYFVLFVPYALLIKVFLPKPKSGWIDSSYPVDFNESF